MKVLLVYPPLIDTIKGPISADITAISGFPPLHLLYIAAHAKLIPGVEVNIIDCRLENIDYDQLKEFIQEYLPDVVGISVNSFMLINAITVSQIVKEINPKTTVVFGGIHPTIYPKETIRLNTVDALVLGEGEIVFKELLEKLMAKRDITSIPGIVTKATSNPDTVEPQLIENLDSLAPPAWELVNVYRYTREKTPVLWLYTSRGCVGRCTFCYIHDKNRKYRVHSAQYVFQHLLELMATYKLREFYVADDCFTVNKKRVIEFCDLIIRNNLNVRWGAVSRIDTLSEDVISMMAKAGCTNIYLGIETGDQAIQKLIKKNLNLEQTKKIIELAYNYGLNPHGYFMIGHPGETRKELDNTITYMRSVKLSGIAGGVAIFQPYPNTASYLEGLQTGIIKDDYWQAFADNPDRNFKFRFWNEHFSNEELLALQKHVNNTFFFRPVIIYRTLREAIKTRRMLSKILSFIIYLKVTFLFKYKK